MALNPNDPNVAMLEVVAHRMGDALRSQLVFTGGSVVGLLITDPAMPSIRPTEDVDLVAQVLARSDYHQLEQALRAQGFGPDLSAQAPICRWRIEHVSVDVMPTLEDILGFSNRWYPLAVASAAPLALPRGQGDHLFSHDLGDLISVIDGRDTFVDECRRAPDELQCYLAEQFQQLLSTRAFMDALPGYLPTDAASQARLPDLERVLTQLADL